MGTTLGDKLLAESFDDSAVGVKDMRKQLEEIDKECGQEDMEAKIKAFKQKSELIQKVDEALQKKSDAAMIDFERNQVMRLKFMCKDTNEGDADEPAAGMTIEELYSADARKY